MRALAIAVAIGLAASPTLAADSDDLVGIDHGDIFVPRHLLADSPLLDRADFPKRTLAPLGFIVDPPSNISAAPAAPLGTGLSGLVVLAVLAGFGLVRWIHPR